MKTSDAGSQIVIVADGWAGAANPHPHPTPHPTPFPTQTHTQKNLKTLLFPLFDSCSGTNGPTDGRTKRVRNLEQNQKQNTNDWIVRFFLPYPW